MKHIWSERLFGLLIFSTITMLVKNTWSNLKIWLSLSAATFLVLLAIHFGLPAFLLLLQVPSFEVSVGDLWILNWKNDASGSGIQFNLVPLLAIAAIFGLVRIFIKFSRKRPS